MRAPVELFRWKILLDAHRLSSVLSWSCNTCRLLLDNKYSVHCSVLFVFLARICLHVVLFFSLSCTPLALSQSSKLLMFWIYWTIIGMDIATDMILRWKEGRARSSCLFPSNFVHSQRVTFELTETATIMRFSIVFCNIVLFTWTTRE